MNRKFPSLCIAVGLVCSGCGLTTSLPDKIYEASDNAPRRLPIFKGDTVLEGIDRGIAGTIQIASPTQVLLTPRAGVYGTDRVAYRARIGKEDVEGHIVVTIPIPTVKAVTLTLNNSTATSANGVFAATLTDGSGTVFGTTTLSGPIVGGAEAAAKITPTTSVSAEAVAGMKVHVQYTPDTKPGDAELGLRAVAELSDGSKVTLVNAVEEGRAFNDSTKRQTEWKATYKPTIVLPSRSAGLMRVDSSFFAVSAIKTVFGEAPKTEFFDVYLRIALGEKPCWFTTSAFDIPLSNRSETNDSITGGLPKLEEGNVSVNWIFLRPFMFRHVYAGVDLRIFRGEPYYGVQLGGIESDGDFISSYFTIGFLRRFYPVKAGEIHALDSAVVVGNEPESVHPIPYDHNLFVSFALHSTAVDFLKFLRIKGSILWPWNMPLFGSLRRTSSPKFKDMQFRIAIEVPVGGIHKF